MHWKGSIQRCHRAATTALVALALAAGSVPVAQGEADHPAQLVVRATTGEVLGILRNDLSVRGDDKQLYAIVDRAVAPRFDFDTMARRVLATHWRKASPEQQRAFTAQFRSLLVRTYSGALREYANQEVAYMPTRTRQGETDRVTVRTTIERSGANAIPVDYWMHEVDGQWKVYDVMVDGISLVINYRASFNTAIKESGLDALVKELAERNAAAVGSEGRAEKSGSGAASAKTSG